MNKTRTGGDVIVEDIEVGDKHQEREYGIILEVEVLTKPILTDDKWTWQSKSSTGRIIDYLVTIGYSHYAPKLYKIVEINHKYSPLMQYLVEQGWYSTPLPWRLHYGDKKSPTYWIIEHRKDSWNCPIYSITIARYDEQIFRGRIMSIEEFEFIWLRTREDYNLTEEEREELNKLQERIDLE